MRHAYVNIISTGAHTHTHTHTHSHLWYTHICHSQAYPVRAQPNVLMYAQRGHNDDEADAVAVAIVVAVTPHSHSLAHPLTHTHTPALTLTLSRTLIRVRAIDFQPSHSVVRQVNISGPTLQSARGVAPTLMCNKSSQRIKKRLKRAHCPPLSAATPTMRGQASRGSI